MTITEIRQLTSLNKTDFAKRYNIPYRTLQDWELGNRECPAYVTELLEKAVKLDFKKEIDNMINELINKIDKAINKKAMKTSGMGTENITVELNLSDAEKETFLSIDKYNCDHYSWEFDNNILCITFTEEA